MSIIIDTSEQGSESWLRARAGRITGSMAHMARKVGMLTDQQAKYVAAIKAGADEKAAMLAAGYRAKPRAEAIEKALAGMLVGDWGEESKKYAFKLAVERISGECIESGFGGSFYTKRGHLAEAECRMVYELRMDCLITETGFMCTDDGKFGVSPDGLIDEDEGWECKGYTDPAKLMPVLLGNDFTGFRDQCLMGLWLTGRRRWTQALYLPALNCIGRDLSSFTIDRKDEGVEDEIAQLETDLLALDALVESYRARLLEGATPADLGIPAEVPAEQPVTVAARPVAPDAIASMTF